MDVRVRYEEQIMQLLHRLVTRFSLPSSQTKESFCSFQRALQGHLALVGLLRNCKQGHQGAFQKGTAEPSYCMPWGLKNASFITVILLCS